MSAQLWKKERLTFIDMLICFPVLKSKANMNNLIFESKRQSCKDYQSIQSLTYYIFYKCTDRSIAHTTQQAQGSVICFKSCYSNCTVKLY